MNGRRLIAPAGLGLRTQACGVFQHGVDHHFAQARIDMDMLVRVDEIRRRATHRHEGRDLRVDFRAEFRQVQLAPVRHHHQRVRTRQAAIGIRAGHARDRALAGQREVQPHVQRPVARIAHARRPAGASFSQFAKAPCN
jgi:hypothetical protein